MPKYDYKCPECNSVSEYDRAMMDPHPVCRHCNCVMTQVFTSPTSFKLVGSGFHKNDYAPKTWDEMSNTQKDSYDSERADQQDEYNEANEKKVREEYGNPGDT